MTGPPRVVRLGQLVPSRPASDRPEVVNADASVSSGLNEQPGRATRHAAIAALRPRQRRGPGRGERDRARTTRPHRRPTGARARAGRAQTSSSRRKSSSGSKSFTGCSPSGRPSRRATSAAATPGSTAVHGQRLPLPLSRSESTGGHRPTRAPAGPRRRRRRASALGTSRSARALLGRRASDADRTRAVRRVASACWSARPPPQRSARLAPSKSRRWPWGFPRG